MQGLELDYDASERRACAVLNVHRSLCGYQPHVDDQAYLRLRIREIATTRVRYGYRRIHVLLGQVRLEDQP